MTAPGGWDARTAAVAFMRDVEDACAERIAPAPGGHAVLDARHPALWDANHLRVESAAASPQELLAAAERYQSALAFRAIHVLHADPDVGTELEAPLHAHGYLSRHDLLMLLGATTPSAPAAAGKVVEATPAEVAPTHLAAARDTGLDADVGRQLASRAELMASVVRVRWFMVLADQRIVVRCALLGDGAVMQIENVYTDPAHRGRGLGGAVVTHAAREARDAGAEIIFLRTDASGSGQRLYRRLGFVDAGLLPRFHRR